MRCKSIGPGRKETIVPEFHYPSRTKKETEKKKKEKKGKGKNRKK